MSDELKLQHLPQEVILTDKSIRFCAVINKLGQIQASQYRKGVRPLSDASEIDREALLLSIRFSKRPHWEEKFGQIAYILARYDKCIRAAIPIAFDDNHLVLVSFDIGKNDFDTIIMDRIMPLVAEYSIRSNTVKL